jgi:hypothetical protein
MEMIIPPAVIFCVIYIFIINNKLSDYAETIQDLEDRLTKLEKDAVKITFKSEDSK